MPAVLTPVSLERNAKVRAWTDLPGVPNGTPGKVLQVAGLSWLRYRVLFENGVEHGLLDGRHIVAAKGWLPVDERVEVEVVEAASSNGEGAEAATGAASDDNEWGVPAHLLERAKAARTRLTGG